LDKGRAGTGLDWFRKPLEKLNKALDLLLHRQEFMKEVVFIINERFTVDSIRNEVLDSKTGQKNRLEPRLMKLLCILAERRGQVVKREFIIKEIWDDYPGANEGLNQAISSLRKLLADEHKEIIQTQPKSGYIFNATIARDKGAKAGRKSKYIGAIIVASVLLLLIFFIIVRFYTKKEAPTNPAKELYENDAREMARKDSIHQAEKTRTMTDTLGPAAKGDSDRRGERKQ